MDVENLKNNEIQALFFDIKKLIDRLNQLAPESEPRDKASVVIELADKVAAFSDLRHEIKNKGDIRKINSLLKKAEKAVSSAVKNGVLTDEHKKYFNAILSLSWAESRFDEKSGIQTDLMNSTLKTMEQISASTEGFTNDYKERERQTKELRQKGINNRGQHEAFEGDGKTIFELAREIKDWDIDLGDGRNLSQKQNLIFKSALQVSEEKALDKSAYGELENLHKDIEENFSVLIRTTYSGEGSKSKRANLAMIREVVRRTLHESRVLELGRAAEERKYLRPSTRKIENDVYGEIMMFLGELGDDIYRAEAIGFVVAKAEDKKGSISAEDYKFIENLKAEIIEKRVKYVEMTRGSREVVDKYTASKMEAFVEEIEKYIAWLDEIMDAVGKSEVAPAAPTAPGGVEGGGAKKDLESLPEEANRDGYRDHFFRNMLILFESGGMEEVERHFSQLADNYILNLISRNADPSVVYMGLFEALHDFNKNGIERNRKGALLQQESELLGTKALEMINLVALDKITREFSHTGSMASDWEKIVQYDREDLDFNIGSYDFFLQESETKHYQYAKLMNWIFWNLPIFIREWEETRQDFQDGKRKSKWHHEDAENERKKFDKWLKKKIIEIIKIIKLGGQPQLYKEMRIDPRWADPKEVQFSPQDVEGLEEGKLDVFIGITHRMMPALGLGQHMFVHDLARGETPGGGINEYKNYLFMVSPMSLSCYRCYKAPSAHMMTEGFRVELPGKKNSKIRMIELSMELTRALINSVSKMRRDKDLVDVGDLDKHSDKSELLFTSYPDFYTFVVRSYPRRTGDQGAGFEAWWSGLKAFESFWQIALNIPGGIDVDNIDKLSPSELRDKMIEEFKVLIHDSVSPMKANMNWVNWRHVAQFILMYVDKMYRVYRLRDSSDNGLALLTKAIRTALETSANNLSGIGSKSFCRDEKVAFGKKGEAVSLIGLGGVSEKSDSRDKADLRDWLLNRIPKMVGFNLGGRGVGRIDRASYDGSDSLKRARSESDGWRRFIRFGGSAFRMQIVELFNRDKIPNFRKQRSDVLYGTPKSDQKSDPDSKK